MASLLRQFIKKRILSQKTKDLTLNKVTRDFSEFNSVKTPAVIFPSERSTVKSPRISAVNRKTRASCYEDRDLKLERLELEIQDFKKKITEFYFSLKGLILVEQEIKERLNSLLFGEEITLQLQNFSLENSFEMVTKVIKLALNLQQKYNAVSLADLIPDKQNERDTIMLIQSYEVEIMKLRKQVIFLETVNQFANDRNSQIEASSKLLAQQCDETIAGYKIDYTKLLRILKEKEQDLEDFQKKIAKQDEVIASLHDKLLSVVVMEHKLKEVEKKFKHDLSKTEESQVRQIREIENTRKYSPNFYHRIAEFEIKNKGLEHSLEQKKLENKKMLQKKKEAIQEKNKLFVKFSNSLNAVSVEQQKLKETITSKNKEIFNLENKTKTLEDKLSFLSQTQRIADSRDSFTRPRHNQSKSSNQTNKNLVFLTINN